MWRGLLQSSLIVFLFLLALLLQAPPLAQASLAVPGCLPGGAAWISGIALGSSPEEVQRKLGPPANSEVRQGEDDGGRYDELMLSYPRIEVFVVRGVVDRVSTTHPESCTAGGICPGITKEHVRENLAKLSAEPVASSPETLVLCPEDRFLSDYYLLIYYTPTGEVARLELVIDRP